jgi:GNAT superfamily N-acetyltransferase
VSAAPRRFAASYQEEVALRDGSRVTLRLVRAEDKELFVRGMAKLSDETRYMRFFTSKDHFSDGELRYLTELDQSSHFALGALRESADGEREGVAVARFVKLTDEPGVAEPAIVVMDDLQRLGLGRVLLTRLVAAARERGITTFKSEVLAENKGIRALLRGMSPDGVSEELDGDLVVVRLRLPEREEDLRQGPMFRLLELAGQGLVRVADALRTLAGD